MTRTAKLWYHQLPAVAALLATMTLPAAAEHNFGKSYRQEQNQLVAANTAPAAAEQAQPQEPVPAVESSPEVTEPAGEEEKNGFFDGLSIDGSVDLYYGFSLNEPGDKKVQYRNFDTDHNAISLNLVELNVAKPVSESSPVGYKLTFAYGPTADLVNSADPLGSATAAHFLQYFVSGRVPLGRGLTVDAGKFVTPAGAEVIESAANWNYSRSLLFAWAIPYYHFGVRASYPLSDELTITGFALNGWNNVAENNGGKTGGAQIAWTPNSRFSFTQTYLGGPEQADDNTRIRHLFDSVAIIKLHDRVSFMLNYDYGRDQLEDGAAVRWTGAAAYLKLSPASWFNLTPRFEWFNDADGFMTGTAQQLKEFTITPEFVLGENLLVRFEYRRDWSNQLVFQRRSDETSTAQNTVSAGLMLRF